MCGYWLERLFLYASCIFSVPGNAGIRNHSGATAKTRFRELRNAKSYPNGCRCERKISPPNVTRAISYLLQF